MKIGLRGFTLVEVMVATCLLAMGIVFIYQTYFTSLDAFEYCLHYMSIAPWVNERIAQAQSAMSRFDTLGSVAPEGIFMQDNKLYSWKIASSLIEKTATCKLYKINMEVSWLEPRSRARITRDTYAFYEKR